MYLQNKSIWRIETQQYIKGEKQINSFSFLKENCIAFTCTVHSEGCFINNIHVFISMVCERALKLSLLQSQITMFTPHMQRKETLGALQEDPQVPYTSEFAFVVTTSVRCCVLTRVCSQVLMVKHSVQEETQCSIQQNMNLRAVIWWFPDPLSWCRSQLYWICLETQWTETFSSPTLTQVDYLRNLPTHIHSLCHPVS